MRENRRPTIGEQYLVRTQVYCMNSPTTPDAETMASHRAQLISRLLPNALAFGYADIDPEREPLKVKPLDPLSWHGHDRTDFLM
jgi:hypothetical protein